MKFMLCMIFIEINIRKNSHIKVGELSKSQYSQYWEWKNQAENMNFMLGYYLGKVYKVQGADC